MHPLKNKAIHKYRWLYASGISILVFIVVCLGILEIFEKKYENKVYPNVTISGIPFGGKTKKEVIQYWEQRNAPFAGTQFEITFQSTIATISGNTIELGYDADLSATQAYSVGRSQGTLTNIYQKFFLKQINLEPYFRWKQQIVDDTLTDLSDQINIPVEDALFQFANGKVNSFKPSKDGRKLNIPEANKRMNEAFKTVANTSQQRVVVLLPVEVVQPSVSTVNTNSFGIKELIGRGYSEFQGSIAGRIHNVALAASRVNGLLIKPGDVFSFNDAVGDISAATGYQSAYIIKDGKTVLGDGGGVCQVSSTLFRAALASGLPIIARQAHAYRVHYYEEGGFKPGLDATVFGPSVDFKFKNDTSAYILIQTKTDLKNLTLTFEFYGSNDGRVSQITNHKVWDVTPPPPALYQDDPTLPKGVVKQVDFDAWGTKASFDYTVVRNGQTLEKQTFFSNFRPWQAVYLKGTL
jgi:vancomycin resistance protein YoaR